MSIKLRFLIWLLAVVATGLGAYVVTAGGAYPRAVADRAIAAPGDEGVTSIEPVALVTIEGDAPWASSDAVAFHAMLELVYDHQVSEARSSAKRFYAEYPASPYGESVQRLTGVPRRCRAVR